MAAGVNVSKTNAYVVMSPPKGVDVSKAVVYVVLSPVSGVQPIIFVVT
jgi:hypothetical protein